MAGIVFLRTAAFDAVREFYLTEVGMEIWLEQPGVPTARTASTPPAVLTSELDKENGNRLIARRTAQRFSLAAPQRGHSPQLPTDMRPRDDVALPRAAHFIRPRSRRPQDRVPAVPA